MLVNYLVEVPVSHCQQVLHLLLRKLFAGVLDQQLAEVVEVQEALAEGVVLDEQLVNHVHQLGVPCIAYRAPLWLTLKPGPLDFLLDAFEPLVDVLLRQLSLGRDVVAVVGAVVGVARPRL